MKHRMLTALGAAFLLSAALCAAQTPEKQLKCQDQNDNSRRGRACEIRESTLSAVALLDVNAAPNGGISVKGWHQGQILVRAKVEAQAETDAAAKSLLGQVRVAASPGSVRATGPDRKGNNEGWSVSYEIFVPVRTDLKLASVNGGVHISDVDGEIVATTVNGGLHLNGLAGAVKATTTNGGIHVDLEGSTWRGQGCELTTTNGGVHVTVPATYSARFEAQTTNGGMHTDLPNTLTQERGAHPRKFEASVGGGGPLVKLQTSNGGVHIKRKG